MPNSNIGIIWTPIFEWYVVRCGPKNGYHKDMYLKEIGLSAQILLTILGLITILINIIEGTYMTT